MASKTQIRRPILIPQAYRDAFAKRHRNNASYFLQARLVTCAGLRWGTMPLPDIPSVACHFRWLVAWMCPLGLSQIDAAYYPWQENLKQPKEFNMVEQQYSFTPAVYLALQRSCVVWGTSITEMVKETLEDETLSPRLLGRKRALWERRWKGDSSRNPTGIWQQHHTEALQLLVTVQNGLAAIPCPSPYFKTQHAAAAAMLNPPAPPPDDDPMDTFPVRRNKPERLGGIF
jgi:hypothetical protein